jgi:hypothetical protein
MKLPVPSHPLHLVAGQTLWLAWFAAIYAGLSVACNAAPPAPEQGPFTAVNAALLLATLLTTGVLGWAAWRCRQAARRAPTGDAGARRRFLAGTAAWLYLVAAVATLAVGLPVALLPPCL